MFNNGYNTYAGYPNYNLYNNNQYNPQIRPVEPQNTTQPINTYQTPIQQPQGSKNGLQGKQVESVEIVKTIEVPLDGSISYFPVTSGSAIVTKQLQNDGTTKMTIFKPITEEKEESIYVTPEELKKALRDVNKDDLDEIRDDINEIKKQIKKKGE